MRNLGGYFFGVSMAETFNEIALSYEQQLQHLKNRGIIVDDDDSALCSLRTISYFRINAYLYPFRHKVQKDAHSEQFIPGTRLSDAINLHEFDRLLRLAVMDAIERFEVCVRALLAYRIAHSYGVFGYTNAANFYPDFDHSTWQSKLEKEIHRRSKEGFIGRFKNKYTDYPKLPIWMATEVMSFGSLSICFNGLKIDDKRSIASNFSLPYKRLQSWLHLLVYIRNICSHHDRLWNRSLSIRSIVPRDTNWNPPITPRNDRVFFVLLVLRHLLQFVRGVDDWKNWCDELIYSISEDSKLLKAMAVPENWIEHPLWK